METSIADRGATTGKVRVTRRIDTPTARSSDGLSVTRDARRIAIYTDGHAHPQLWKTAVQLLRYRLDHCVAVVDREHAGRSAGELFGLGESVPVVGSLRDVPDCDSVFLGIAPPGGALPQAWLNELAYAAERGVPIVSGLHGRLSEHEGLRVAAAQGGASLVDLRMYSGRRTAEAVDPPETNLRVLTVGSDCSVGKMSAAMEIQRELVRRGRDASFLATGQTGVMVSGEGLVADAIVSDFLAGAIEHEALRHADHEITLVEGQGSIVHPAYSGVSLGLMHGAAPDAMVLCHELGRNRLKSIPGVPVRSVAELIELHEQFARLRRPSRVIGLALNGRRLDASDAEDQIESLAERTGLPACDVYRDGPGVLADAVEAFERSRSRHRDDGATAGGVT